MKIILTGGTGFIGQAVLNHLLEYGHHVVLLTRHPNPAKPLGKTLVIEQWDAATAGSWVKHLEGADAVINLAGESIAAKRWTAEQKNKIISSRINAAQAIINGMKGVNVKPSVLINASAIGFYGNVPEGEVNESSPMGKGFLAETCGQWEQSVKGAEPLGVRTVLLRFGVVLEQGGGALSKILPPFQFFAGGPLGSGKQWFSWIHREDIVGAIFFALGNPSLNGAVNVTAPEAATMGKFCKTLGKVMGRPSWAPVPAFALRLLLGEMADMLLEGQRVVPEKLLKAGYIFRYPELEPALRAILKK